MCKKIQVAIGPYKNILTTVKKRKLRWFGHVIRSSGLCKKDRTRHSTREKIKRKAKEKTGRQHQRVDRSRLQQQSESSRRPSEMAEDCRRCQLWCPYDHDCSGTQVTGNVSKVPLSLTGFLVYILQGKSMFFLWICIHRSLPIPLQ